MPGTPPSWSDKPNPTRQQLINAYVTYLKTEPETESEYRALEQAHGAETEFNWTRLILRKWRKSFADMLQAEDVTPPSLKGKTAQFNAIKCLHAIKQEQGIEARCVIAQFAFDALSAGWTDDQKNRFYDVAQKLINGYDYFLSFTGSNPNKQDAKLRVNHEYDEFIRDVLTPNTVSAAKLESDNLLAMAIYALLTEKHCNGFSYLNGRGDGAEVQTKLERGCKTSASFVQLLDNEMFIVGQNVEENYCYIEYKHAIANKLDMLFLFPYEDRKDLEEEHSEKLDDWYQKISQADLRVLPPAPMSKSTNVAKLHQEVNNLAKQIKVAKNNVIESIPA